MNPAAPQVASRKELRGTTKWKDFIVGRCDREVKRVDHSSVYLSLGEDRGSY